VVLSGSPLVSSTNKTDCHDITEILLKVALNTIKKANNYIHCTFNQAQSEDAVAAALHFNGRRRSLKASLSLV
jgi:hypothetical protein